MLGRISANNDKVFPCHFGIESIWLAYVRIKRRGNETYILHKGNGLPFQSNFMGSKYHLARGNFYGRVIFLMQEKS